MGIVPWATWQAERTGFGRGFRLAAQYPAWLPLLFSCDHYSNPITALRQDELNPDYGLYFTWNPRKAKMLRELGVDAHCVQHPWNFLNLEVAPHAPKMGTLLFLPHGHDRLSIEINWDLLRNELYSLPERYWPFTVCVSAAEVRSGKVEVIRRELRLPIVSAGAMESQFFPEKLWRLISRHSYSAGFSFGSQVMYSIWAGRPHILLNPNAVMASVFDEKAKKFLPRTHDDWLRTDYPDDVTRADVDAFLSSLSEAQSEVTDSQSRFVSELLNSESAISRRDLQDLIWNQWDKYKRLYVSQKLDKLSSVLSAGIRDSPSHGSY